MNAAAVTIATSGRCLGCQDHINCWSNEKTVSVQDCLAISAGRVSSHFDTSIDTHHKEEFKHQQTDDSKRMVCMLVSLWHVDVPGYRGYGIMWPRTLPLSQIPEHEGLKWTAIPSTLRDAFLISSTTDRASTIPANMRPSARCQRISGWQDIHLASPR